MKTFLHVISNFKEYQHQKIMEIESIYLNRICKLIISLTFILLFSSVKSFSQGTYSTQTGTLGTTYSWIDCSSGTTICNGDDVQSAFAWPFNFSFYGNNYTTSNNVSVSSNGFIRLNGTATTSYNTARYYNLTSTATNLGQIIGIAIYDGNERSGWIKYLTTGTAPNRILTVEFHNYEIDYNDRKYCNAQASFYETSNKVVLKLGTYNINKSGVDMGIHSGVSGYYHKWQEVLSGTNNAWIEYSAAVQVSASVGLANGLYPDLKSAFDKINDGSHKGAITIKIHASTIETSSAVLNASGSGNANYTQVNIYPISSGLSISGNLNTPLIDLNGADNVTVDGRVNGTGTTVDLSIFNQSTSSVVSTSVIRFINDATYNTVEYCELKGSQSLASSGILFFSTTTGSNGNSNNTINNNNITTYDNSNRPVNTIFSSGTVGKDNSSNVIKDNKIYDFLKHITASNGIFISSNSTAWTIDGNSFYETTSFSSTGTVTYCAIKIDNTLGNDFTIINNQIGGSDANCASSPWTKTNTRSNVFNGIYLNIGSTSASSIQNNTIKNFSWNNSSSSSWSGIYINSGAVNVGTITGNTIGDTTGTSSIDLSNSSTTSNGTSYGIYVRSTNLANISNNLIGSIRTTTSGSVSYSFTAINKAGNIAGNINISDNFIGSLGTSNSIQAATVNTLGAAQNVYGINSGGTGNNIINENTISNLYCAHEYATANSGQVAGIYVSKGVNEITANTIKNLSSSSPSSDPYGNAAVIGICQLSISAGQTITGNTITNLHSTYSGTRGVNVLGIYYYGGTAGINTISSNYINNLTLSSTAPYTAPAVITAIKIRAGANLISNNVISLGQGSSTTQAIYGIHENGNAGHNNNIYFNTVYIGGTTSGNIASSYAFYNLTNNNARDIRNNIFANTRSGGSSGNHYAIRIAGTTSLTIDYNDYYVSGSAGVLGKIVNTDKSDLTAWKAGTSQDANSIVNDPVFLSAGGSLPENYNSSVALVGVTGTGVTVDYDGVTRNSTPKIGAFETTSDFIWTGTTNTDFANTANWQDGIVPPNGANISFAASPSNDCTLDQNRTLKDITNTSNKKLNINGHQLTLTGNIVSSTTNQIDASSSSSSIIFKGSAQQVILSGIFVSNTIGMLTLDNSHGLVQNGDIIVGSDLTLTLGTYSIGANTLTLNGAIAATAGLLSGGSSSNIVVGGSGADTLPVISLNNLTLNRATGISLGGDLDIDGTLTLTSGTLTVGANTLTLSGSSPARTSGDIDASNASATLIFDNSSTITLPASIFSAAVNNLTINGAGITAGSDFTIDNVLNLISANPTASKGALDMDSYTLSMGVGAANIGDGDVSGIVKREHTFTTNTQYSFGSAYTTFTFIDANTRPTWIEVKIELGSTPSWTSWTPSPNGKVTRVYKVACSNNSSTSQAEINMRYLTSELDATYNDESKLIFWHKFLSYQSGVAHEHGKSSQNLSNHYLTVTGLTFGVAASTNLDDSQVGIAYSVLTKNTWKGEVAGHETEWENAQNWTAGTVPTSSDDVLIPSGLAYYPSLTATATATVGTIEIESGASITANSYDLVVHGAGGAWINNGTFYPGTGNIKFDHGVASEIVTISGTSDFNNFQVDANTTVEAVSACITRISGAFTIAASGLIDFTASDNEVDYNGGNQTVINTTGISSNVGYYILSLSGTGTKTMPNTALNIEDEFFIKGTASATAGASITIGGEIEIYNGATFSTGNFDHFIGGHFDNSGTFNAASGTKITLNGSSAQSIYGASTTVFEKLTIDNTAGINVLDDFVVNNTLTLTNGTVNVGSTTLTINGDVARSSGNFNFNGQSSLIMGGTTAQNFTSSFFSSDPSFVNLTINRTGGVIIDRDALVSGLLYIQSNNPSATIGALDLGANTLLMGANATTTGDGDVTGIVKRTTILPNVEYSFGHQYTSVTFSNYGTLPTEISLKIEMGTAPTWQTNAVKRIYDLKQTGASGTLAVIKGHYLDSELNGNDEQNLIDLTYDPLNGILERGRSNFSNSENWITLDNTNFGNLPSSFGIMELGFGIATTNVITWDGSTSTSWEESTNWTPALTPSSTINVIIPDASTTTYDPTISATSTIKTINIQTNGVLNSGANTVLTIVGDGGAWINEGTFNPSTGKIIFGHGNVSEIATIAGSTNFYNIEVSENTVLQPVTGCYLSISGAGSAYSTSIVDFTNINNTVEWNGGAQTIVNPIGIGGSIGYYNLIISGSGTKTMPTDAMTISGDLTISGTTTVTAADSIIVAGNLSIVSGSTFGTGSSVVQIGANFDNQGTFTAGYGGEIYLFGNGSSQTISASSSLTFEKLRLNNLNGITLNTDVNVNDIISFCNGPLNVGAHTLVINGTIYNPVGNLNLSSTSNLTFGGSGAITIENNLFGGNSSFNNLTVNRAGGVSLGNEDITVNGTLNLIAGTLSIEANYLTLAGNSPTLTSGNIDASNASAYMVFGNSSSITLPNSLFAGNINNLTLSGSGGVISNGNLTVDGILNLEAQNPSSTAGILNMNATTTLNMGISATTIGVGDVTGIVRREHTFTNGIAYSFGSAYTTINFIGVSAGVKPSWLSCKIELGTAPVWRTTNVKRVYSFAQAAGGNDRVYTKLHYLNSELSATELDESLLTIWNDYDGLSTGNNTFVNGETNYNTTNNWIELIGMATDFIAPSTSFAKQYGIGYSNVSTITWTGLGSLSYPGDWSLPGHWSGGVPTENDDVVIPATLPSGSCGYPNNNSLNSNSPAVAKTITIESGAQIDASGFDINVSGEGNAWVNNGTFISGVDNVTFDNGDPTKTVSIAGNVQFNNLIISDKTKFEPAASSNISITGNLTCDGTFSSTNANTVTFNSSSANQSINGNGIISFNNLTVNNTFSSGEITLGSPVVVNAVLTLTKGKILSDDINSITLSSTASASGGNASSYVDGPMIKEGTTSFVFPIGSNDKYARIAITNPTADFVAQYYNLGNANAGSNLSDTLTKVSLVEYWNLEPLTSGEVSNITLYFEDHTTSGINNTKMLRVAHWTGATWENLGNNAYGSNFVTSLNAPASFSPFTIGTIDNVANPLPIALISFDSKCDNQKVVLSWETASEYNNENFLIERSNSNQEWTTIANINGAGNSNTLTSYEFTDYEPNSNANYYRLKQVDFDGKFTYSKIINSECTFVNSGSIKLYPNPGHNEVTISVSPMIVGSEYLVFNNFGQQILAGTINTQLAKINIQKLPAGIYLLIVKTQSGSEYKEKLVVN